MLSILFPFGYRYTSLLRGKHTKASCRPSGNRFFSIYHRTTNYYYNSTINNIFNPRLLLVSNYFYYPSSPIVFSHPLLLHFGFWPRTEPCSATDCHPYTYYINLLLSSLSPTVYYYIISPPIFYQATTTTTTKQSIQLSHISFSQTINMPHKVNDSNSTLSSSGSSGDRVVVSDLRGMSFPHLQLHIYYLHLAGSRKLIRRLSLLRAQCCPTPYTTPGDCPQPGRADLR